MHFPFVSRGVPKNGWTVYRALRVDASAGWHSPPPLISLHFTNIVHLSSRGRHFWQTFFKFDSNIPFFHGLDELVGQQKPSIFTPLRRRFPPILGSMENITIFPLCQINFLRKFWDYLWFCILFASKMFNKYKFTSFALLCIAMYLVWRLLIFWS